MNGDTSSTQAPLQGQLAPEPGLLQLTHIVYGLQAAGLFLPVTFVAAVIINYVKREDAAATWLEGHFRWQIRTFWFGLLWSVLGVISLATIIGWVLGWVILGVTSIWVLYRIIKGWLRLSEGKLMYPPPPVTA